MPDPALTPADLELLKLRVGMAESQAQKVGAAFAVIRDVLCRRWDEDSLDIPPIIALAQATAVALAIPRPEGWFGEHAMLRLRQLEEDVEIVAGLAGVPFSRAEADHGA